MCRYLNAVQTTAQHLLRYLAAAVVVNKRRRSLLKDMVKVRFDPLHGAAVRVSYKRVLKTFSVQMA